MSAEAKVREAAAALTAALSEAKAAGLVVVWPKRAEDLASIAISETAKVGEAADGAPRVGVTVPAGAGAVFLEGSFPARKAKRAKA